MGDKKLQIKGGTIFLAFCFVLFCLLTFLRIINHQVFFDEAHAWMIAKNFSFIELFNIERYEGHLFIWHALLMPFAKNDFLYPYSMQLLNWIFSFLFVIIFVAKAPFSTLEKGFFMLSYPVVCYFAIIARCYSIGIFFLFLILALMKDNKHPVLISVLIVLLANTSVMAGIPALVLAFIFLYDLYKEKKNMLYPASIIAFGIFLFVFQLFGVSDPDSSQEGNIFIEMLNFYFKFNLSNLNFASTLDYTSRILSCLLLILSPFYLYKSKKSLIFLFSTYLMMVILFLKFYGGAYYHFLFFFIFFISAIWLRRYEISNYTKFDKMYNILILIFLILALPLGFYLQFQNLDKSYGSFSKKIVYGLKTNNVIDENWKIYGTSLFSDATVSILPYFPNIKIYNTFGEERYSLVGFKHNLDREPWALHGNKFVESMAKDKINVLFSKQAMPIGLEMKKYILYFSLIYADAPHKFYIYKITPVEKK